MNLKKKEKLKISDTCAASDMAFLLIIYFIVIAGFNVNTGFLMNLPAKDSTRRVLKENLLRFELDATGILVFEDQSRTFDFARRTIQTAVADNPNIALSLAIDPEAPWQDIVSFVEIAQSLKIDSFSFAMKPIGENEIPGSMQ